MQKLFTDMLRVCGLILLISILCTFVFKSTAIGDGTGNPYSGKNADTIGAWYDEVWQASGFYRTKIITGDRLVYGHTNDASTAANPTFVKTPISYTPGTNAQTGASISSDMVVTEWKVTGHLHFKSGL